MINAQKRKYVFLLSIIATAFIALIIAVSGASSAAAVTLTSSSTIDLTGGTVLYSTASNPDADELYNSRYKNMNSTDYDNYIRRATFKLCPTGSGSYTLVDSTEQTLYTNCNSFTLTFDFKAINDGVNKSWITTRHHMLYLCKFGDSEYNVMTMPHPGNAASNAASKAVAHSSESGASVKDVDCTISKTYKNLPDGRYTLWTQFYQGHGVASSQFKNYFTYAQDIVIDTKAPILTASSSISRTDVSASFAAAATTEAPILSVTSKRYYKTSGGTVASTTAENYTTGTRLSVEGKYEITAIDKVGNSSTVTMTVDRTPPMLTLIPASDTKVSATWSVAACETKITATYVLTTAAGTSARKAYTSGTELTVEGKYEITATDEAGNSTTETLYVDKSAPSLSVGADASSISVSATWSDAKYESPTTATYTYTSASGASESKPYTSGAKLTDEGKYEITVTDAAGNTALKTLYVDKTAPSITPTVPSKTSASATWNEAKHESPTAAMYTVTNASGTSRPEKYIPGTALTVEGKYTFTVADAAGNSATAYAIVDKSAPILSESAPSKTSVRTSWSTKAYESGVSAAYSHNGKSMGVYENGKTLSDEGKYEITATDEAGNSASVTLIVDRTPPVITAAEYSREPISPSALDTLSGVAKIEIYVGGKYIEYDRAPCVENGQYFFRATDGAGNSNTATAVVYRTDTFGNLEEIRDAYKTTSWYTVTLPARIFTTEGRDVAGRYSFESYAAALDFAVAKEREFRVTTVQGGYMYVSTTNESISQKYTDAATLAAAVERYAKTYISGRRIASESGKDSMYTEPESLTRNSPRLPNFLREFEDLPHYYMNRAHLWTLPADVKYINAMPYKVTAKYLGDIYALDTPEFVVPRGTPLCDHAEYMQGWYLITETDAAGNAERYLVYSDAELPTANVTAVRGDRETTFALDRAHVENNTMYYLSLCFNSLADNVDSYVTIKIEKNGQAYYYTQSDELPVLGAGEFGAGRYTVTLYDRSLNVFGFDVYIAGSAPTWTHGSLAADKPDCKISFAASDRYNVITSLEIYKVEYDGTRTPIETLDGVSVSAATLSYRLTSGGKYGATVRDNFGRCIELDPVFFLKGLPSGRLSGVSDGGRTNKNVSVAFDGADVCELFVLLPNGERRAFSDYNVRRGATDVVYDITATDATSHEYLVFLHAANDPSLFVEYTFEIDTVLPEFYITDANGASIQPDGATNKSFSLSWQETGVTVRYYTARSGALNAQRYTPNTMLALGTLYYFTIKDDVGNSAEFTVLLDNTVDYTVGGKYSYVDGVLYANESLTFTVNEPTQKFEVENADGYTVVNGGAISQAGAYRITVTDNYRNTVTLDIVIDYTPPMLALDGVDNGGSTNGNVTVTAADHDELYLVDGRGNVIRALDTPTLFDVGGLYTVQAKDRAGNVATVTFAIDRGVDFTLSLPRGGITADRVTLTCGEKLDVAVVLDGEPIGSSDVFTLAGRYELSLTDELGNSAVVTFVIVPRRAQSLSVELPSGTCIAAARRDGMAIALDTLELDVAASMLLRSTARALSSILR